ncbi:MAG: transposase [Mariprofundaceae bacterium]|nr:transposase [Mariprofundaceae bacterium]
MTGRVTMLGMSRWSVEGGSYRTIQRFLGLQDIPWKEINWSIVDKFLMRFEKVRILAGDEATVTKSGKETFGVDRFFSSIQNQVVPSMCFLCISVISVKHHRSFPLVMHQLVKDKLRGCSKYRQKQDDNKDSSTTRKDVEAGKRGRKKGSKNINRRDVKLSKYMQFTQDKIAEVLGMMSKGNSKPTYFLFDGEFGNNFAVQMTSRVGLYLISKLRRGSKLYIPWQGEYSGRGRKRVYGDRFDPKNIPAEYLISSEQKDGTLVEMFQVQARHKKFPDALNIVIIRKTKIDSGKVGHVILFSSDLDLAVDKIVEYYSLRYQIEFNFRDAKQYWGLEDFMVVRENKVRNSASFSMFMVNMSYALIAKNNDKIGQSVHDLKVWFLARKQVLSTLKLCSEKTDAIFIRGLIDQISMKFMVNGI